MKSQSLRILRCQMVRVGVQKTLVALFASASNGDWGFGVIRLECSRRGRFQDVWEKGPSTFQTFSNSTTRSLNTA